VSAPVGLLQSLQQVQTMLATMYPSGSASAATSDSSTIDSFQQILATLSPTGSTAGGILGSGRGLGSASTASAPVSSGPTGADVVADAEKYLGVPYVLDGESTKGIDCSGLVQKTYKDLGVTLPRTVHEQKLMGTAVPSLAQAQPGDLIVFKGGGHVAIYEGNNTVIHAPYPGRVVSNQKLWVGDSGIETIRRIVPSAGTATAATTTTPTPAATPTSAATQAAALAAVQAIIQADFGLLSSPSSSSGSLSSSNNSASTQLQSVLSSLSGAGATGTTDTSSASSSSATASVDSAQQALAMEQSLLAQEEL
jgi:peptidoglycan DL-endopeptidase CwlO